MFQFFLFFFFFLSDVTSTQVKLCLTMTRKLEKNLELGRKQMITPGEEGRKRIQKVSAYSL